MTESIKTMSTNPMPMTQITNTTDDISQSAPAQKDQKVSSWTSYNGPRRYVRPVTKTKFQTISAAISKALEGAANSNTLKKMRETIENNSETCHHFLILFRNNQFKSIYDYDEKTSTITKLDGIGPKSICPEKIEKFYKFDFTKRQFTEVETKHIGPTIIGIALNTPMTNKRY